MMVLWEEKSITVKALGQRLFLDSGTLSPVLKSLEEKSLVTKTRDKNDERTVIITITENGEELKEKAKEIPQRLLECISVDKNDALQLYTLLYKTLGALNK